MKKYCFFTFCFFLSIILYGQSKLQDYTLDFPGTSLKLEMIAIPAGTFVMGGNTQSPEEEKPPHKVALDEFWMAKYETTWDLYNLYLERSIEDQEFQKSDIIKVDIDAVSGATIPYVDMSLGMGKGKDLPVGNVTYLAASQFCKWLSAKTGDFYRLPTEAEWEFAARGGIVDVFPPQSRWPLRLELLGEELESIRAFDPENQRSRTNTCGSRKTRVRIVRRTNLRDARRSY